MTCQLYSELKVLFFFPHTRMLLHSKKLLYWFKCLGMSSIAYCSDIDGHLTKRKGGIEVEELS